MDVYCCIKLKEASKTVQTCSYSTPKKYKEAWATLIQQHLDASRIHPSNSAHASPTFLVPKSDMVELPHWVNDYRELNLNTVLDSHSLPCIDNILADCAKGKFWSKMDMTNSFFQTSYRIHPGDVHLITVRLEWLVMPMGLQNSRPIHQHRVTTALQEYIHIYMHDIVIWSNLVEEHIEHIWLILAAFRCARLYCNPKKCKFFLLELNFLGHHISAWGIEAQLSKVDKILQWPVLLWYGLLSHLIIPYSTLESTLETYHNHIKII